MTKILINVLAQTNRITYNRDGSFSFISHNGITIWCGEINKKTIESLGGEEKLRKFINDIKLGKTKVYVDDGTLKKLESALNWSKILDV